MASGELLYNTELSSVLCDDPEGCDGGTGKQVQEGADMCIRLTGEGNGNPLCFSCLENPMDGGAWQDTVHGVTESDTTESLHYMADSRCCTAETNTTATTK